MSDLSEYGFDVRTADENTPARRHQRMEELDIYTPPTPTPELDIGV